MTIEPPFGSLAPSPAMERVRHLARGLGPTYFGRKAASLLLGAAGGRAKRAYDVSVFESERARLQPYDNLCEKRVYLTPQLWEAPERAFLEGVISSHDHQEFVFADIGANVGLYTLFARAACKRAGKRLIAVCVEADPTMHARFEVNMIASGAGDDVRLFKCAASGAAGPVAFSVNTKNRGMSRIDAAGMAETNARPLIDIFNEARVSRLDALKIDIEGHEYATLRAFFSDAPAAMRPQLLLMEYGHEHGLPTAEALALQAGYACRLRTKRNLVLARF